MTQQEPDHTPDFVTPDKVLEQLLNARYSCRAFRSEPVPVDVLKRILTMAQRTASWCNTQPWDVTITQGQATSQFRKALTDNAMQGDYAPDFAFPNEYIDEYLARRRECGMQLYNSLDIARDDRVARKQQELRNFLLFDAPHVAIVAAPDSLGVYGAVDCGAYISNFMLAAKACGVAAVAQAALALCSPFIRDYFDLEPSLRIVCGISFGYAQEDHPVNTFRTSRVDLDTAVRLVS